MKAPCFALPQILRAVSKSMTPYKPESYQHTVRKVEKEGKKLRKRKPMYISVLIQVPFLIIPTSVSLKVSTVSVQASLRKRVRLVVALHIIVNFLLSFRLLLFASLGCALWRIEVWDSKTALRANPQSWV